MAIGQKKGQLGITPADLINLNLFARLRAETD